jgi:hypothetical protein
LTAFNISSRALSDEEETRLEGSHLVVHASLQGTALPIETNALIDCGATGVTIRSR